MSKHVIQTDRGAPPKGAYSQGWRAGDFVFVTGTGPLDPVSGELVGNDIEKQTEQTIPEQWLVLVTCRDEKEQVELLTRWSGEGWQCKALLS